MPNYGFICNGCNHTFDMLLTINDRENPLKENCPNCGHKKVVKDYGSNNQTLSSDHNLNPNSATGGKWNELMSRMKNGIPKRYHENLDSASKRTGRTWLG